MAGKQRFPLPHTVGERPFPRGRAPVAQPVAGKDAGDHQRVGRGETPEHAPLRARRRDPDFPHLFGRRVEPLEKAAIDPLAKNKAGKGRVHEAVARKPGGEENPPPGVLAGMRWPVGKQLSRMVQTNQHGVN